MTVRRHGPLRRATGIGLVVVALIAIAALVVVSPVFAIRRVEVDGNATLSDREVRSLSGTELGDNLVLLSVRDVERGIESSPWIADAAVARRLPDTLVLRVTERRAVAAAHDATATFVIGGDGVVLGEADASTALPSLGRYDDLSAGDVVPGPLAPVRVVASLPRSVRRLVDTAALEPGGVVLRFATGGYVTFGPATEVRRKAASLEGVLRWAEERGLAFRYIDVRVPESPVLRPTGRRGREVEPPVTPGARG